MEQIACNSYIRVTFFIDSETNWSEEKNISYFISIRKMPSTFDQLIPRTLMISSFKRIGSKTMPPFVKAGANYLNSRYAHLEATRKKFDGALFLTENDFISESTGSCILFINKNTIITPSKKCDILLSITRELILNLAHKLQIEVIEKEISKNELTGFEAAILVEL